MEALLRLGSLNITKTLKIITIKTPEKIMTIENIAIGAGIIFLLVTYVKKAKQIKFHFAVTATFMSYSQIWCMANQAASCSTLIPSLNFTPSMTSANRL